MVDRSHRGAERTFGWFNNYRRLDKDYEYYPRDSETII